MKIGCAEVGGVISHDGRSRVGALATLAIVLVCALSCGPKPATEGNIGTSSGGFLDVYNLSDGGLLFVESRSADSILFDLLVGQGERCTGGASGIAVRQRDGLYVYGDDDCSITFKQDGSSMMLTESGDLCEHGANCDFQGTYTKVATEDVSPARGELMNWPRMTISDFACEMSDRYGHRFKEYACGVDDTVNYKPSAASWYRGPEFPPDKTKEIHGLAKNVAVDFEHGEVISVNVVLERPITWQAARRIFSLPDPYDNYDNDKHGNVMAVTFDNYDATQLRFSVNPVFVTSFTLTGFEHMGAGDSDDEQEPIVDVVTTYEYKPTGDTFTLVNEDGPGPYEFTCTGIATVSTSSELKSQGTSSYGKGNLTDMTESTAWAEGKPGLGLGEWIEFKITDAYKKWGYNDKDFVPKAIRGVFVIQTGYAKSPGIWKRNGRPVKLRSYHNGRPVSIVMLRDTPDFQLFNIFPDGQEVEIREGDVIRFEILDVVKGMRDEDACISEFHIEGSCG